MVWRGAPCHWPVYRAAAVCGLVAPSAPPPPARDTQKYDYITIAPVETDKRCKNSPSIPRSIRPKSSAILVLLAAERHPPPCCMCLSRKSTQMPGPHIAAPVAMHPRAVLERVSKAKRTSRTSHRMSEAMAAAAFDSPNPQNARSCRSSYTPHSATACISTLHPTYHHCPLHPSDPMPPHT